MHESKIKMYYCGAIKQFGIKSVVLDNLFADRLPIWLPVMNCLKQQSWRKLSWMPLECEQPFSPPKVNVIKIVLLLGRIFVILQPEFKESQKWEYSGQARGAQWRVCWPLPWPIRCCRRWPSAWMPPASTSSTCGNEIKTIILIISTKFPMIIPI